MRIAYFDCFCGISGDMVLGALIDAGVSPDALRRELTKLPVGGYELASRSVTRCGVVATKVDVLLDRQNVSSTDHQNHRNLNDILNLLEASTLDEPVRRRAEQVFKRLAEAEARVHNTNVDEVRFHEVGAVDAIVDIVGASIGLELLGVEEVVGSPVPVGSGFVECVHGKLPVPAPAVVELLKGYRLAGSDLQAELTTPTGAAIITTLSGECGPMPPMTVELVGYGAGHREFENQPNLLRIVIGEDATSESADAVWRLETNIDDMNPELISHVFDRLLAEGALDVFAVPVQMKKGRTGLQLTVLCTTHNKDRLERVLFAETTTFGVRSVLCHRRKLSRKLVMVKTELGELTIKVGSLDGRVCTASPEYEQCRRVAQEHGIPLREVYARAEEAYRKVYDHGHGPKDNRTIVNG